jgi:hypothetical protein
VTQRRHPWTHPLRPNGPLSLKKWPDYFQSLKIISPALDLARSSVIAT